MEYDLTRDQKTYLLLLTKINEPYLCRYIIYLKNETVVRNATAKALSYDQLACPNFDDLPLNKYLMPYPVLPWLNNCAKTRPPSPRNWPKKFLPGNKLTGLKPSVPTSILP